MTAAAVAHPAASLPHQGGAQRTGLVHRLALGLVALTIVSSGLVFSEPAPVDALAIALMVLLPTLGLVAVNPMLVGYFSLWAVVGACAVLAATLSLDLGATLTHVGVTLYLYAATVLFAAFIAKSPARHTALIMNAWTCGALIAAGAGLIGYFDLLPGAYDLFTRFDRASGTFKDPNVLGPFLIVPLLYMLHLALHRSWRSVLLPLTVAAVLLLAVLLTFSRGAWINLAVALAVYGYLTLLTAERNATRLKLTALLAAGALFAAGLVAVALSSDTIANMLAERASVALEYDVGAEGRFGGQEKAVGLIAENPLGIGAQQFALRHHPEEAHNVYLSMPLNAGWLGGGVYWILVGLTLVLGFRHAMKASPMRPLFLVAYAAFVGVALEGLIVDTDHWRHFYLIMAVVWGLMSLPAAADRTSESQTFR
jgi:O-antigen ligase